MKLQEKVDSLPDSPGVYLMKNRSGKIIYVGKAESLRNRVRSYFRDSVPYNVKTEVMVRRIQDFDYIVTRSEVEALILELTLIKKHKPRYNVRLTDDKKFPYIKVTLDEPFPRVFPTRTLTRKGARLFGPYTDAKAMRQALKAVRRIFPVRTCRPILPSKSITRPCLEYHIGHCQAPCVGYVTSEAYRKMIHSVMHFLEGRTSEVVKALEERMNEAAEEQLYEEAARLRDQLKAVRFISEKQAIVSEAWEDMDIIAFASRADTACVVVLSVREGRLVGRQHFFLTGVQDKSEGEVLGSFLEQHYEAGVTPPKEVVLQSLPQDPVIFEKWLSDQSGQAVKLTCPKTGGRLREIHLAIENAKVLLEEHLMSIEGRSKRLPESVVELQKHLHLTQPPRRIEAFDISQIQGSDPVGSMVYFYDGQPRKGEYRRFRIRTVEGQDDCAMMREVVARRLRRLVEDKVGFPDLILIDGGLGQLNAALEVLRGLGIKEQPVLGLAKRLEEVYRPGEGEVLSLPKASAGLRLLQHLRDEAHRFAVAYHRLLRGKRMLVSSLDGIQGLGSKRRAALLEKFGSVERIKQAELEDLASVPGISPALAERIAACLSP
jgi:excinuclease ABC subunit C